MVQKYGVEKSGVELKLGVEKFGVGMHRGWKGPFNYFSFWFFMARIKHWDIVR